MTSFRWIKADETAVLHCCPDHTTKLILYARTYTPRQGYSSETNQLILNLKIKPSEILLNSNRRHYKDQAISRFAAEVSELLNTVACSERHRILVPMPPSMIQTDPDYDDRILKVAILVSQNCPSVTVVQILKRNTSIPPSHSNQRSRSSAVVCQSLTVIDELKPQIPENTIFILLDDIITSGATFEGARLRLQENFPSASVAGIFWAKSKTDPP